MKELLRIAGFIVVCGIIGVLLSEIIIGAVLSIALSGCFGKYDVPQCHQHLDEQKAAAHERDKGNS